VNDLMFHFVLRPNLTITTARTNPNAATIDYTKGIESQSIDEGTRGTPERWRRSSTARTLTLKRIAVGAVE